MLGGLIKKSNIVSVDAVQKAISETIPFRFIDLNQRAFKKGYNSLN
jgi:Pyruvate/2-oxoacid:ferredoxin oxidoreductase gamma subunit